MTLRFARYHSVKDNRSKKNWFISAHVLTAQNNFSSEAKVEYVRSPRARRALARAVVSSMRKQLVLNGVHINIQHRRLTKSLKLTESTACFSAARKKLFREMATSAARIVYD